MKKPDFKKKFEELLMNNTIPEKPGIKNAKFTRASKRLYSFTKENIPTKLYRYRTCADYNIQSFEEDKIYASNPYDFNDPFDSLIYCDKQEIRKFHSEQFENNWLVYFWNKLNDIAAEDMLKEFPDREADIKKDAEEMKIQKTWLNEEDDDAEFMEALRKFYESEDENANLLCKIYRKRKRQWLEMIEDTLNDIADIKQMFQIACFSEKKNSMLMWSHYADNHKGFVLEYDLRKMVFPARPGIPESDNNAVYTAMLFPVIYTEKRYDATQVGKYFILNNFLHTYNVLNISNPVPDVFYLLKIFLNKAKCWEYENEWRLICMDSDGEKAVNIQLRPTAIYYGSKITSSNRERLSVLAKAKQIPEYEAKVEYGNSKYSINMRKTVK